MRLFLLLLLLAGLAPSALGAQAPHAARKPVAAAADSDSDDEETSGPPLRFGVAAGALQYSGGRSEQAFGAIIRWNALPWLSFAATPATVRMQEPAVSATVPAVSTYGLVDLPVDATLSHAFGGPMSLSVAAAFGVTLPVGDTTNGFGSGEVGYDMSGSVGLSPTDRVWIHLGAGRSLSRFSVQSAYSSGTGWGDASIGTSVTDRFSVSGGFGTDLGAVDSTFGRSTSIDGEFSYTVRPHTPVHLGASHGVSGSAPNWSFTLGFGTAFPYLNHAGGASTLQALQQTFGGGTHGLPGKSGTTPGKSGTAPGRGRKNGG